MSRTGNTQGGGGRECGHPGLFVSGMAVALAGFMLIWAPWKGLMFVGAVSSFGGTVLLSMEAWRLAVRRWRATHAEIGRAHV